MISLLEKNKLLSWGITLLIAITIFYVSSLTSRQIPGGGGTGLRAILYHIIIFFLFAFFLAISLVQGKKKDLISLAIILAVAYGITDEIHQYFVPGRASSFSDFLLDSLGILFASMIYFISLKSRHLIKLNNKVR